MSDSLYRFDGVELNWNTRELFRQGEPVAVEPKALELIHYLLLHRDRAVAKDELARALWPDRVISDTVISQTVRKARIALNDDGERQQVIATVRGYGYRFVATLVDPSDPPPEAEPAPRARPEQGRASARHAGSRPRAARIRLAAFVAVAVLFVGAVTALVTRIGPDAERTFNPAWAAPDQAAIVAMLPFYHDQSSVGDRVLAQSLTEALHMRLAEISGIEIRSPRVVALLLEENPGLAALMGRAEVDFLLSGTLEPALAADRRELGLELSFQRADSIQAVPLGRFTIPFPDSAETLAEFMHERDTIIKRLIETLLPAIAPALADGHSGTHSPDAFRLLLGAIREVRAVQCDNREVEALLRRAIEIDPEFDHARMAFAWVSYIQYRNCGLLADALIEARSQIERVLVANPTHPVALLINTLIEVENGRIEHAYERLAPALDLHPTSPQLRLSLAHALTYAGFLDLATAELDALIAADPLFLSFEKPHLPLAYLYQGHVEDFLNSAPSLDVPSFRYYRAVAELLRGDEAASRALLGPASRGNPVDLASDMSAALLAVLDGHPDTAIAIIDEIAPAGSNGPSLNGETLFQLGRLLHLAGARERALDRFENAIVAGFFCPACLENDAGLADLSEHPRWLAILDAVRERHLSMAERMDPVRPRQDPREVAHRLR